MKKALSLFLVVVTLATAFSMSVSADNFVPSITNKPAPELVTTIDGDGKKVIGHVVDPQGNKLTTEYHDCLVITSVFEAKENATNIPEDARTILLDVYDELSADDMKLSTLSDELNKQVADKFGNGNNADKLVVKDLFDISVLCDELEEELAPEGNVMSLTFKLPVDAQEFVAVMTYNDGEWSPIVSAVNNGNGTITCTFEHFCPVAFLVPEGEMTNDPPAQTGDNMAPQIVFWGVVMVVSTALIVVLVVGQRNKRKRALSK